MAVGSPKPNLAKDVQALFSVGVVANLSDGRLLERFASGPDGDRAAEAAFTEIVRRHGPMVLRVCRNILNDPHDAQDATQATFLVLVRKAGSIRSRDSVAGWLHGTALRVARRARADAARRRLRERSGAASEVVEPDPDESRREGWPELHEELARLPEKYRAPLVLCYLEGMTTEVAARKLGCPQGTILCRLSRGRERLRGRLIRRGLTASAALLALEQSPEVSGAMSAGLMTATVKAALQFAYGESAAITTGVVSARGLALAKGVLRTMFMTKIKLVGAVVLAGTTIAVVAPMSPTTKAQQPSPPEIQTGANKPKVDGRWAKKLPSGIVVELVGVNKHQTGPETWWSPNGELLSDPPGVSEMYRVNLDPNPGARDFAIRVLGSLPKTDDLQIKWKDTLSSSGYSGWVDFKDRAGRVVPGLRMFNGTFAADLKSASVEIGVATGPWKTEATCTPDGKSTLRSQYAVIFGQIQESEGKVSLTVAHHDIDSLRPPSLDSMVRVLAVDHDGKTYSTEGSSWHKYDGVMLQWFRYTLSLKSIKEFQFQTRPYEWAEFINVPLQPPAARQITP